MKELHVGYWPDRKLPMLTLFDRDANSHRILATFKSEAAMKAYLDLCRGGIQMVKPAAASGDARP